ncbi:sensor histidine kinase [Agromyces mangrovi Wang et al. 2018]|uniref:sensor histidine kinase n=1 Tax=Agromyces mangrovi TaxID=1858653 RepID=UPI0025735024|nr:sensor domain-containing protein [Agromyces mangrovi]
MSDHDTAPRQRRGYFGLWAGMPRELVFLLIAMPIAWVGFSVVVGLISTGFGLLVLVVGVLFLTATFYVARGFGWTELRLLHWTGRPEIRSPWPPASSTPTFWRGAFGPFIDGHYWLYVLHVLVVAPIVSLFTFIVTVVWVSIGLGGATYWFWERWLPLDGQNVWTIEYVWEFVFAVPLTADPRQAEAVFFLVLGLIFLVTLPLITRGLTLIHQGVALGMLGPWRSQALEREVQQLSASRGAAVQAEDRSLRRLERDIHDGPQQRLVRLQMDLAAAERAIARDPEVAPQVLGEAREQAREALDELRALSRGFAPPILQDRGLAAGLASLAARSPVPVEEHLALPEDAQIPAEIERNAYFIAAELLTNAAKHASARAIGLHCSVRRAPVGGESWLDLWVIDDGAGGAMTLPGHGLSGLEERVRGLRGILRIDSPAGGPTTAGAHIPFVQQAAPAVPPEPEDAAAVS